MKFLLFIHFLILSACQLGPPKDSTVSEDGFLNFWEQFKQAVLSNSKGTVEQLTLMPFSDNYNEVYDKENSLSCVNAEEFLQHFELIFDEYVVKAINENNYRAYDKDYSPDGDIIGIDDYLLVVNHPQRPKDLLFKKQEDGYRLVSIQYYE